MPRAAVLGLERQQFPSLCSFTGGEAISKGVSDVRSAVTSVPVKVKAGKDT